MKLGIEHIVPYLPYGLNGMDMGMEFQLVGFKARKHVSGQILPIWEYTGDRSEIASRDYCVPLLHPLSMLKESKDSYTLIYHIEKSGELENWCDVYDEWVDAYIDHPEQHRIMQAPYEIVQWLIKNHYDVFGLIPKKLAEPIKL